jgi:ribosome assembly protein YihI (activator of Der GTPase)
MFQKDKCDKQNTPSEEVMEYHTDELNQETEWIPKKNKKRRRNASPELSSRQQKVHHSEQDKQSNVQKNVRPLPIIVGKVQNYQEMYNHQKKNNKPNFQTALLNSGEIKINAEEEKDYRDITRALNHTNIEWYSFENKLMRPMKVMARNIHVSCSAEGRRLDRSAK